MIRFIKKHRKTSFTVGVLIALTVYLGYSAPGMPIKTTSTAPKPTTTKQVPQPLDPWVTAITSDGYTVTIVDTPEVILDSALIRQLRITTLMIASKGRSSGIGVMLGCPGYSRPGVTKAKVAIRHIKGIKGVAFDDIRGRGAATYMLSIELVSLPTTGSFDLVERALASLVGHGACVPGGQA